MSTTGVTLSQSSTRSGSRPASSAAEQPTLTAGSSSRASSRVKSPEQQTSVASASQSRAASRVSNGSAAVEQPALSGGSRTQSRVSNASATLATEQQPLSSGSRAASRVSTAVAEEPALSGSRASSRVSAATAEQQPLSGTGSRVASRLSNVAPSEKRTASQASASAVLAEQQPSSSRTASRVSQSSGIPVEIQVEASAPSSASSRSASRVSNSQLASVSQSGSRTASRVSNNSPAEQASLSSRSGSRVSAVNTAVPSSSADLPALSSSGSRTTSRVSQSEAAQPSAGSSASQRTNEFYVPSEQPAFSSFDTSQLVSGTPVTLVAQSNGSQPGSRTASVVSASGTPVPAAADGQIARKSFEARSRFNHRIKSRNLANPDAEFSVDLNIDKVLNPNCPESPKFNNAVIRKEGNSYTLDIDVANYDPSSIDVQPQADRIVITASYEKPLSDKKTEYGELNHSYRLPNAEITHLESNLRQDGHLIVQIPFNVESGVRGVSNSKYPVVSDDGRSVTYTYELPSKVNSNNVDISFDGRKVILRANDSYEKNGSQSATSFGSNGSFCFFHSVTFPSQTNFDTLNQSFESGVLTLSAELNQPAALSSEQTPSSRASSRVSNVLTDLNSAPQQSSGSRTASRVSQSQLSLGEQQTNLSRQSSRTNSQTAEQPALSGSGSRTASGVSQSQPALSGNGSRTASRVSNSVAPLEESTGGSRTASRVSQSQLSYEQPALSGSNSRTASRVSQSAEQPALSGSASRTASQVSQSTEQPALSSASNQRTASKVSNSQPASRNGSRTSSANEQSRISNLEAADAASRD